MSEPDRHDAPSGTGSSAVGARRPVEEPVTPPPGEPVDAQPGEPVAAQPVVPVDAQAGEPVAAQPAAVAPQPDLRRDLTPGATDQADLPPERTTWHRDVDATTPAWSTNPVAVRRADPLAALLLLLAGIAAAISLLVPWTPDGPTGLGLARLVVRQLGADWTGLADTGLWQPGAVLAGGAALFLIGLFLLVPAKAHRFLGVLALLVAAAVVAAVLVPLVDAGWQLDRFDVGFWFAIAVAALGVLGALKAVMTGPRVR